MNDIDNNEVIITIVIREVKAIAYINLHSKFSRHKRWWFISYFLSDIHISIIAQQQSDHFGMTSNTRHR